MRKVLLVVIVFCDLCLAEDQSSTIIEEGVSVIGQQESEDWNDGDKKPFPSPPTDSGEDFNGRIQKRNAPNEAEDSSTSESEESYRSSEEGEGSSGYGDKEDGEKGSVGSGGGGEKGGGGDKEGGKGNGKGDGKRDGNGDGNDSGGHQGHSGENRNSSGGSGEKGDNGSYGKGGNGSGGKDDGGVKGDGKGGDGKSDSKGGGRKSNKDDGEGGDGSSEDSGERKGKNDEKGDDKGDDKGVGKGNGKGYGNADGKGNGKGHGNGDGIGDGKFDGKGDGRKCRKNEEFYPCGVPCHIPQTCLDVNKQCTIQYKPCRQSDGVCGCRAGYVRNKHKRCVNAKGYCKRNHHKDNRGGSGNGGGNGSGVGKICKNGVYYSCPLPCPQTCKFFKKPCTRLPPRCVPDEHGVCGCREGDVLNEQNKCVSGEKYCNQDGHGNEGGKGGNNGHGSGNGEKEQYEDNRKCGSNQMLYKCGIPFPQTCKYVNRKFRKELSDTCGPDICGCIKGYVRNKKNKCVNAKYYCNQDNDIDETKKCPPNQVYYRCGLPCPQTCYYLNEPYKFRPDYLCKPERDGLCGCAKGYVRNHRNKCVAGKDYCGQEENDSNGGNTGSKCNKNEVYYPCGVPCSQTCDNHGRLCYELNYKCGGGNGACGCVVGFVRNGKGKCVNAEIYCNGNGNGNVSDVNRQCKNPNEQYYTCGIGCPQSCKDQHQPCQNLQCIRESGACLCKPGYVRNKQKQCVRAKGYCNQGNGNGGNNSGNGNGSGNQSGGSGSGEGNAKQCQNRNEQYYSCGVGCPQSCDTLGQSCVNPQYGICKPGKGACLCKPGYVRNKQKKCVRAKGYCNQGNGNGGNNSGSGNGSGNQSSGSGSGEGNNKQCKNRNEQYYPCGVGCSQSCDTLDQPCMDALVKCKPGSGACLCKPGYVRNKKKKCVRAKGYCQSGGTGSGEGNDTQCKNRNEQYYPCGVGCPQSCDTLGQSCVNPQYGICKPGKGACLCKPGYVRNKQKKCVRAKGYCNQGNGNGGNNSGSGNGSGNQSSGSGSGEGNNKQCKNRNEQYYPCGVGCSQSCDTLDQPCMDALVKCKPGSGACLCKPGYVRNKLKKCVRAKGYCNQESCSGNGNGGNSGDHENDKNCNVKRNEKYYPCGVLCPQSCKNIDKACMYIQLVCNSEEKSSCGCREGYVRNEKNICVDAKIYCNQGNSGNQSNDIQCKRNEQYNSCGVPCGAQTCETVGQPCNYLKVACKGIKGACVCRDGYVRNKQNKCVRAKDYCNQNGGNNNTGGIGSGQHKSGENKSQEYIKKCRANEMLYECGRNCPETCKYVNVECEKKKRPCKRACGCLPGFVRDEGNRCVTAQEYCCGPNEERVCGQCDRQCGNLSIKCCRKDCVFGCYCRDGYARDGDNRCVSISDCDRVENTTYG